MYENNYRAVHWIGQARLDDLLSRGPLAGRTGLTPIEVFVMALTHTPEGPIVSARTDLMVCMLDTYRTDCVRYWQMPLGSITLVNGRVQSEDQRRQLIAISNAAESFMRRHLEGLGYRVTQGTIARPSDLILCEGIMDQIGFNADECAFFWKPTPLDIR